ncbi:motility associated factor glycosyltransferase family protein [Brevibacillus porteri]|uniref:motility associated factor glycosyltransferase family protein n=1 Tax=Brevibacillus porteri TaxID=2126350 RepID=UPI003D1C2322
MIQIDNLTCLKKYYSQLWENYQKNNQNENDKVRLEESKTGGSTIAVLVNSGWNYIHSKYNPVQEAQRFIQTLEDIGDRHVLFYGVGLGYHIDEFIQEHPSALFSIYEPNAAVFSKLVESRSLEDWSPSKKLVHLMLEVQAEDLKSQLSQFTHLQDKEVYVVVHPSYERIFAEQTKAFIDTFRDVVYEARNRLLTGQVFAKRMAINGLFNMPHIMKTPNILDGHGGQFQDKPAIIVGAGPSLNDEFENLRYIKENGLAYIFSVGSAINQLINAGITPDATFAYDGSALNSKVFEKVIDSKIDNVPLVFGSTMGFETVNNYHGKMANFLVRDDYIMDMFIKRNDDKAFHYIDRFGSIATLTLQVLSHVQFSPIILVGINLAFRGNEIYAKGINYTETELTDWRKEQAIVVKDVEGKDTYTSKLFLSMKDEMEQLIERVSHPDIINATKEGAHIEGTVFSPLETVIRERLTTTGIVQRDWVDLIRDTFSYDLEHFKTTVKAMTKESTELDVVFKRFEELFDEMEHYVSSQNSRQLDLCFNKFDKLFDRLQRNKYYLRIIQSMNYIEFNLILKMFDEVRSSTDIVMKARRVIDQFKNYLFATKNDSIAIKRLLEDMYEKVIEEGSAT